MRKEMNEYHSLSPDTKNIISDMNKVGKQVENLAPIHSLLDDESFITKQPAFELFKKEVAQPKLEANTIVDNLIDLPVISHMSQVCKPKTGVKQVQEVAQQAGVFQPIQASTHRTKQQVMKPRLPRRSDQSDDGSRNMSSKPSSTRYVPQPKLGVGHVNQVIVENQSSTSSASTCSEGSAIPVSIRERRSRPRPRVAEQIRPPQDLVNQSVNSGNYRPKKEHDRPKLGTFSGEYWRGFIKQFELAAERSNWSEREKIDTFAMCLRKDALDYFSSLPMEHAHDFNWVKDKFNQHFERRDPPLKWRMSL
jgi:hypothetical protein